MPEFNGVSLAYIFNPQLIYIPISGCEFLVRAGHLEGYSVIITDDGDGVAQTVFGRFWDSPFSSTDVSAVCNVDEETVAEHLNELVQAGILLSLGVDAQIGASSEAWIAFARYGTSPSSARLRPVHVYGDALAERLVSDLEAIGVAADCRTLEELTELQTYSWKQHDEPESDANFSLSIFDAVPHDLPLLVIALASHAISSMQKINIKAIEADIPVLYVQSVGAHACVGPFVQPAASACFWEFELQRSRSMFDFADYRTVLSSVVEGEPSQFGLAATSLATIPWILEIAATGQSNLLGRALIGRVITSELQMQTILRLPRCPTCLPTRPLLRNPII